MNHETVPNPLERESERRPFTLPTRPRQTFTVTDEEA